MDKYKNTLIIFLIIISSNLSVANEIRTQFDEAKKLDIDFNSLRIGTAEYPDGPTGCTVFYFPKGA